MKILKLFLLNTFIALCAFTVMKQLEGYYGTCLLNYEFNNSQTSCGLTTLELVQMIGSLLLGIIIINSISIKKSKNIAQYLIISSPQAILLYLVFLGLFI